MKALSSKYIYLIYIDKCHVLTQLKSEHLTLATINFTLKKVVAALSLIEKYDIPTPRYTSYPTVPYWDTHIFSQEQWMQKVKKAFQTSNNQYGISLYIHLPFCEQLCTYCGCNKRITVNHDVEDSYITALLIEWEIYKSQFQDIPVIAELHLGGGTPTFFSPANLEKLITGILEGCITKSPEFSIEVHPNFTTKEHLQTLAKLGFTRISIGVQDFDPVVQKAINRIQTFEKTKEIADVARALGFESVNTDIIYGLPFQTIESIRLTVEYVKELRPERIAFYSYAHVPWISKAQRRYSEADLPTSTQKRALYESGRAMLEEAGYKEIGMDHFALVRDELFTAYNQGDLHRNFMGYTTQQTKLLIGLGASSISDTGDAFMQNEKEVEAYETIISAGILPISKGHLLSEEDLVIRQLIKDLMCKYESTIGKEHYNKQFILDALERLKNLEDDGLVLILSDHISITEQGKAFLRNICLCFDSKYWQRIPEVPVFSKSV